MINCVANIKIQHLENHKDILYQQLNNILFFKKYRIKKLPNNLRLRILYLSQIDKHNQLESRQIYSSRKMCKDIILYWAWNCYLKLAYVCPKCIFIYWTKYWPDKNFLKNHFISIYCCRFTKECMNLFFWVHLFFRCINVLLYVVVWVIFDEYVLIWVKKVRTITL